MVKRADLPSTAEREVYSFSPEARRKRRRRKTPPMGLVSDPVAERQMPDWRAVLSAAAGPVGPGTRPFEVVKRTVVGTYNDGFIHAGNLAYLSMLAIFPFFIIAGALFPVIGEDTERQLLVDAILLSMPPTVASVIDPVASDVMGARSGWFLWLGVGIGLWTVSSLVETIRDILRRAYGTSATRAFWKYRLASAGLILAAVILLLFSLFATVAIGTAQQVIDARFPQLNEVVESLRLTRILPALGLGFSLYMLFYTLTPTEYRSSRYPKWPGAVVTTLWWLGVTTALPMILRQFFTYNLTYGSLAGIIVALFFFWLVGLGLVIGAELNAALAEPDLCDEDAGECEEEERA